MGIQEDVRRLSENPTLGVLEPEALRLIAFTADTRILRAGDVIFRMGEVSDGGYVLLSGTVMLETNVAAAQEVRPPGLMGDMALISETLRPCTAIAREPSSVLKISRPLFHRVLSEYPTSAQRLRDSMRNRVLALGAELARFHVENA